MPEIGATLREARMRARVDITEVELATKIRAKYLRAMENEEWDLLPGPTFVKSFLRTYAEYLGLDGRLLVDEYKQRHEGLPEHEPQPISPGGLGGEGRPRLQAPTIPRGWVIGLSVVGILAALIVLGSISGDEPASITASTTTRRAPRRAVAPPPKPTRVSLQLIPNDAVYVCLRNASDALVLSDTLQAGATTKTYRSKRFRLTLGNNALTLKVNGRKLSVPASAEAINYELTPGGRKRLSQSENAC